MIETLLPVSALAFPNIDPVIFSVGPLAVHWYGLGYVVGIMFAWWYGKKLLRNHRLWGNNQPPMQPEALDDFVIWAALGVVLGGRIGYVLFYNFSYYLSNPLAIPAVWDGGMSFHGGILGTTIAMIWFARSRGIKVWSMFDVIAAGVPVGLGVVRVANFINSELWGRVSDVPWAFYFPNGGPEPRHPSQLYEAFLEGFVLFFVLLLLVWVGKKAESPRLYRWNIRPWLWSQPHYRRVLPRTGCPAWLSLRWLADHGNDPLPSNGSHRPLGHVARQSGSSEECLRQH